MIGALLRLVSIRHAARARLRTTLTVGGIAIGVAVLVAVAGVNGSVLRAFRDMLDAVSGKAVLTVSAGPQGFPEEVLERVRATPGVSRAAASLGITVPVVGHDAERIHLLAVDLADDGYFREYKTLGDDGAAAGPDLGDPLAFLNSTDQVLLSERVATRLGLKIGDSFEVRTSTGPLTLKVKQLLRETGPARAFGGSFGVMDVYAAQIAFGRERTFDRIDVDVVAGADISAVRGALSAALGPSFEVDRPDRRGGNVEKMLRSFRLGLSLGSLVALLVGVFLVYNTVAIGVVQRRREIGTLRALGATAGEIKRLFLLEGLVYGVLGAAIGLPLGQLLARGSLGFVAKTVSSIYIVVNPTDGGANATELGVSALGGIAAATFASWRPAAAAAEVAPVEALRKDLAIGAGGGAGWRQTLVGLGMIAIAWPVATLPSPVEGVASFGYVGLSLVFVGAAACAPQLVALSHVVLRPLFGALFGVTGRYAADNFTRAPGRSAVPVAALTVGVAMTVCVTGFVGSFRHAANRWIEQTVPADLFITGSSKLAGLRNVPLDPAIGRELAGIEGVEAVDHVRIRPFDWEGLRVFLVAVTPGIYRGNPTYLQGDRATGDAAIRDGGCLISENLARRRGLKLHDVLTMQTPTGPKARRIGGVIVDYTGDQGVIFLSTADFERDFLDDRVDTFELYLTAGTDEQRVRQEVTRRFGEKHDLFVLTNRELRDEARKLIDDAFAVTYALQAVAVLLALLGVVNTLLAAVLDRTRELGLLRAIGASRAQIVRAIAAEAGMIGLTGGALGVASGTFLSMMLVFVVGTQATGWSLPFRFPIEAAVQISALSTFAAVLAGLYPARRAASLDIVEALAWE